MKFKDFVRERDVKRIIEINNFFNQPLDIILEVIELGKTKIVKSNETNNLIKYYFKINNDVYEVMFGKKNTRFYEMSFSLERGNEKITDTSNDFSTASVYSGLLDTVKLFIEEKDPDKIIMNITLPKKFKHFHKMIKYVFKKYDDIFNEYIVKNMGKEQIDDIIEYNVLVIERK